MHYKKSTWLLSISILFLIIWSLMSVIRDVTNTQNISGSIDFHSYWYSGLFVRQGIEPYTAFVNNYQPNFQINFIGGSRTTLLIHNNQYHLAETPANTAPLLLLLTLFSFFPWEIAKYLWLFVNLVLAILLPWIVIRYLKQTNLKISGMQIILIPLIFWSMLATRNCIGNGQTSIIVLFLMALTLLLTKSNNRWIAGILFGFALSKYSMALPLLIYLIYKKEIRIIVISFLVQILGVILVSILVLSSPLNILVAYIKIALIHEQYPGIHLAALFTQNIYINIIFSILGLAAMFILLFILSKIKSNASSQQAHLLNIFNISILFMISLLTIYHREYDLVMLIFPLGLVLFSMNNMGLYGMNNRQRFIVLSIFSLIVFLLILPGSALTQFFPTSLTHIWNALISWAETISTVILLILILRLLINVNKEIFRLIS